ncbi:hypothetical protein AGRHK599_LOCUS2173 [Rhizobium rhizogenes]|uniref:Uncharacterized protein n=1 Tax=Rhizobium rhizogenes TaxID=359 RepID=A0AAN2A482_RHIRH|nr:hypothetical protein AGRHK599_LOCUS2173 [Rhizobium rhizogenes]
MATAVSLRLSGDGWVSWCWWVWLTPLCPAGHLSHKEGDRQDALPPPHPRPLSWPRPRGISISPLWERCPAGQRGVSGIPRSMDIFPAGFPPARSPVSDGRPFPVVSLLPTKNPRPRAEDDPWHGRKTAPHFCWICFTHPPRARRAQLQALPSARLPAPSRRRAPRSGARVRG